MPLPGMLSQPAGFVSNSEQKKEPLKVSGSFPVTRPSSRIRAL